MHFNGLLTAASTEYLFFASCHAFLFYPNSAKHTRARIGFAFCILFTFDSAYFTRKKTYLDVSLRNYSK